MLLAAATASPEFPRTWPLVRDHALGGGTTVRPSHLALASLVAALTFSTGAFPGASPARRTAVRAGTLGPAALRFGRSIGSPTDGHLVGGSHLDDAPYLRAVPVYAGSDVRWGLEPLVGMLDRAARQVRRQYPDAITSFGHLSRMGGGDLDRHHSHESGRDADIGFFIRSATGRPLLPSRFVQFNGEGTAAGWPGAYFDDARNWTFVAALVTDPEAHVTHIFVAAPLRARLLAYAERMGAPANVRLRAAEVLQQPRGALPHDDHFHVRIGCPAHMSGCVENPAARTHKSPGAPAIAAHGRRGASPSHGLVTRPPTPSEPMPALPAGPVPAPNDGTHEDDPAPDAPPAAIPAPIDDVDG
jgi:penicillin-insensitive murein endopeptidase